MSLQLSQHAQLKQAKPVFTGRSWRQPQFFSAVRGQRTLCTSLFAPQKEIAPDSQVRKSWRFIAAIHESFGRASL